MAPSDPWLEELLEERRQKDEFMARHPESPFVSARVPFHPLRYFPPDPAYRVPGRIVRMVTPQEAYLRTNRDGSSVMRHIGELVFELKGRELTLRVYHAGEGVGAQVFVPFRDTTSGRESYGPGRYLTLELNEQDAYDVDFNRAFNPYCAYTDDFECGFPPAENDLPVPIRAGERAWQADENPATPSSLVKARTAKALGRAPPAPPASPRRRPAASSARRRSGTASPKRSATQRAGRARGAAPRRARSAAGRSGSTSPRSKVARRRGPPRRATGAGTARGAPSQRTVRRPPRAAARAPASSPSRRRGRAGASVPARRRTSRRRSRS